MNLKVIGLVTFLTVLIFSTGLVIVFIIPKETHTTPAFPFKVSEGTLLEVDPENHMGIIWGQGFEITILQSYNDTTLNLHFRSVKVLVL